MKSVHGPCAWLMCVQKYIIISSKCQTTKGNNKQTFFLKSEGFTDLGKVSDCVGLIGQFPLLHFQSPKSENDK